MKLSKKEKEFLFDVLDNLTDRTHYCEISDEQCERLAYPIFRKLRMDILGY